jgi:hypothetical protein
VKSDFAISHFFSTRSPTRSGKVFGEVPDEISGVVSDEVNFATIVQFICYMVSGEVSDEFSVFCG